MNEASIRTDRLLLRRWKDSDLPALTALNQDPIVMEFIGPTLSETESLAMIKRSERSRDELGYGRYAVEIAGTSELIGFIGLAQCKFESHFTPAVEIGWRLANEHWGSGYVTEGAKAVVNWAFENCQIREIVSFSSVLNLGSRRVMENIGMDRNIADDFLHPNLTPSDPLRSCVLYRRQMLG